MNLPIGALAWLGIFFFCRIQKVKSESMLEKLRALDWAGSATITTASVLLLIGLTFGSQAEYGWSNPTTISTLVLGAALYPVFALIEAKFAKIPMVPLHLFKNWNYRLLAPNAFILGINTYGPTYYIPLVRRCDLVIWLFQITSTYKQPYLS